MQYIELGKTGLQASRFGLGCMRFPRDQQEAKDMVRYALDNGVNYVDTAYVYGESESIVGRALKDGYREKAILASKSPTWQITSHGDFEKILDVELKRLQVDYIDMYLLHDVNTTHWELVKKYDGLTFLDKMKKKGKIKHKCCSFHGPYDHFNKVLYAYDWEMIQIQLNILDDNNQAGVKGLKNAYEKDIPVVIMEPLRGGGLIQFAPSKVNQLVKNYPEQRTLVEWAFRYLYNMPEVSVILSGASSMAQLKDSISIFNNAAYNVMSEKDQVFIKKIKQAFMEKYVVPCTGCGYCTPCPYNVNIPEIFTQYNLKEMTHHWVDGLLYKRNNVKNKTDASQCVECGQCITHCPQFIDIPNKLKEAHKRLI